MKGSLVEAMRQLERGRIAQGDIKAWTGVLCSSCGNRAHAGRNCYRVTNYNGKPQGCGYCPSRYHDILVCDYLHIVCSRCSFRGHPSLFCLQRPTTEWLMMFCAAAPFGLWTGANPDGPVCGNFGFGELDDWYLDNYHLHPYLEEAARVLKLMGNLMTMEMKKYVDNVSLMLDHETLVPKVHVSRARWISDMKSRRKTLDDREREKAEAAKVPAPIRQRVTSVAASNRVGVQKEISQSTPSVNRNTGAIPKVPMQPNLVTTKPAPEKRKVDSDEKNLSANRNTGAIPKVPMQPDLVTTKPAPEKRKVDSDERNLSANRNTGAIPKVPMQKELVTTKPEPEKKVDSPEPIHTPSPAVGRRPPPPPPGPRSVSTLTPRVIGTEGRARVVLPRPTVHQFVQPEPGVRVPLWMTAVPTRGLTRPQTSPPPWYDPTR